ncbi:MAG: hypothetical protein A2Z75_06240 [Chloroflexi bacterium RBG_13_50_10]|nr:MAG: hypothetical protein A2Z75_06240 [Chloroflexi bacterium RBG_13_50_10]
MQPSSDFSEAGSQHITAVVRIDPHLFTAFALLNAVGYNAENGWQYTSVRKAVRLRLAGHSDHWRSILTDAGLLETVQRSGGAMLMDIVPLLLSPPDFLLQEGGEEHRTSWQSESRSSLGGIDCWLRRFYEDESLAQLWKENLRAYEEAAGLLQPLGSSLEALAQRFGEPSAGGTLEIVLMPNLLDAKGRGYSVSTAHRTWLFLGPLEDSSQAQRLVVHELLHRWVDVAAERAIKKGAWADPMPAAMAQFRIVAESYPNLSIWVAETVVRAATSWLLPSLYDTGRQSINGLMSDYEQIGFVGAETAYAHLVAERGQPLADIIQEVVDMVFQQVLNECAPTG